jgi:hypothetical protein
MLDPIQFALKLGGHCFKPATLCLVRHGSGKALGALQLANEIFDVTHGHGLTGWLQPTRQLLMAMVKIAHPEQMEPGDSAIIRR